MKPRLQTTIGKWDQFDGAAAPTPSLTEKRYQGEIDSAGLEAIARQD